MELNKLRYTFARWSQEEIKFKFKVAILLNKEMSQIPSFLIKVALNSVSGL